MRVALLDATAHTCAMPVHACTHALLPMQLNPMRRTPACTAGMQRRRSLSTPASLNVCGHSSAPAAAQVGTSFARRQREDGKPAVSIAPPLWTCHCAAPNAASTPQGATPKRRSTPAAALTPGGASTPRGATPARCSTPAAAPTPSASTPLAEPAAYARLVAWVKQHAGDLPLQLDMRERYAACVNWACVNWACVNWGLQNKTPACL